MTAEEKKEGIRILKGIIESWKNDQIQVELTRGGSNDDSRLSLMIRMYKKEIKPKRDNAIGVVIDDCPECSKPYICSRCNGHGWVLRDKFPALAKN